MWGGGRGGAREREGSSKKEVFTFVCTRDKKLTYLQGFLYLDTLGEYFFLSLLVFCLFVFF